MFLPMACQHCEDAPCIKACPCGALHKESGGTVAVDYNICCGHGSCVDVCPYVHKANGDAEKKALYKEYMAKRKKAGYNTPAWFPDEEEAVLSAGD